MKKIPSLFQRNYDTDRLCRPEIVPGCEWVIEEPDQVTPSRKWDGTSCMVRAGQLFKRYDRKKIRKGPKAGEIKAAPEGWEPCEEEPNEHTGHWPGWVPVSPHKPEDTWHLNALHALQFGHMGEVEFGTLTCPLPDGTYELIGPKVNNSPEGVTVHQFIPHGVHVLAIWWANVRLHIESLAGPVDAPMEWKAPYLHDRLHTLLEDAPIEGVVFRHTDGRMAKAKARDFGIAWPR